MSSETDPTLLAIRGLRKSFGALRALRGVTFSLHAGERMALLGPNGAGKTTLIRCLCGRTRPDAGELTLQGRPLDDDGIQKALGVVPQEIALYGDLTTRENLVVFARFHGLRGHEMKARVEWALDWTGLRDRAHDLVGGFSGGMQRRVNLACGVMHRPRLLLLDEPTVGVDPQSRQRIFAMLDELNQAGTSMLLTTHQLDEAEQRSDRIVIIDQGRVIADGSLDQLVEQSVGTSRLLRLRMDRPLDGPILLPSEIGGPLGNAGDERLAMRIDNVSLQLPVLLNAVHASGLEVSDVEVHAPSLHDVFLHLTGYELRD